MSNNRGGWTYMLLFAALVSGACGDDASSSGGGGSCIADGSCFTVTSPADYDVEFDCKAASGVYSTDKCSELGYARKCTENVEVEQNGKTTTAVFVHYYEANDTTSCAGVEEML